jgi:quercetin dioxygenase-like cupin family protein
MSVYQLAEVGDEFVTPKHSTAFGKLISGTQIELGVLSYKAGEGAKEHAHPHEQIFMPLKGKCILTIAGEPHEIGPGQAALIPPNVPHKLDVIEDTEVVSCKGIVGGVGHRI